MLKIILLSTVAVASLSLSYVHAGKPGEELVSSGSSFSRKRLHTDDGASSSDQSSNQMISQAVDHEGYTADLNSPTPVDYSEPIQADVETEETNFLAYLKSEEESDLSQLPVVEEVEVAQLYSPAPFDEDFGFNNSEFVNTLFEGRESEYLGTLTRDTFDNHESDYARSPDYNDSPVVEGYEIADLDSPTPVDYSEPIETDVETEENNFLAYLKSFDSDSKPEEESYLAYLEYLDYLDPELGRFYYFDRFNSDYGPPVELDNFLELSRMHRRRIDSYQHLGGQS